MKSGIFAQDIVSCHQTWPCIVNLAKKNHFDHFSQLS